MDTLPIHQLSAPSDEFLEPPQSSKPITASSFELRPSFIAMVWEQTFSGHDNENPYHHLREFEQLCSCLSIAGMAQETLRWKLFPFSFSERVRQWYAHNIGKVNVEWEELRDRFCLAFFPISRIASLQKEILDFRQDEKESLGAAWARFSQLTHAGPDLSIPDHVLLQHFWLGLSKESALQLDISAGGSFTHKTTDEGEALLDRILENTSFTETLPAAESSSHEEVPLVEYTKPPSDLVEPTTESSPEPETMEEEEIQPPEFPFNIEEGIFQNFGNTSMYPREKRPPVPRDPVTPPDKASLQEAVKVVTAVMNSEWAHEGEMSTEAIRLQTPLYTLPCFIQ